ncbi:MAG: PHP domain-containing protein [Clostridia bacterium]|nr:PHP domain-containing protein [Clostridia bacterium]
MHERLFQLTPEEVALHPPLYNYHTHNYLCRHATGTVSDYVEEAVRTGFSRIGISDHLNNPGYETYLDFSRMKEEYLPQFAPAYEAYGNQISIFKGGEIEYLPGNEDYYAKLSEELDYLVLGEHFFRYKGNDVNSFTECQNEDTVLAYFDTLIQGVASGYFCILAHPSCPFCSQKEVTPRIQRISEELVLACKESGVKVELNANGPRQSRPYPQEYMIDLCLKHRVPVTVGSDAHNPAYLRDEYEKMTYAYACLSGLCHDEGFIPWKKER